MQLRLARNFTSVSKVDTDVYRVLSANTNQARGLAEFGYDFMNGKIGETISNEVYERVDMFHTDSVLCGLSALSMKTNAPTILRNEALTYKYDNGGYCFGSNIKVRPEKAVLANSSAVREWDSNGTVFGFNNNFGIKHQKGEFGHNDYYPSCIVASQMNEYDGKYTLKSMLLQDEIRGRLAEVFSLKTYKIDHVVYGAIATAVTYGILRNANIDQIESAIGMVVAHYIPYRAIRAGHQLSDSKGASAAISSEVAILAVERSINGFIGPNDIFRNPQSLFRLNEPTKDDNTSPFDIILTHNGNDFSVMGMHFKLGLYEHQSAGAIQSVLSLLKLYPEIIKDGINNLKNVNITIYEPAFSIIGDPAKKNPTTRQSADHSMLYIIAALLNNAYNVGYDGVLKYKNIDDNTEGLWKELMLLPQHYSDESLNNKNIRSIMEKITFKHGGKEYDDKYPDGIPTKLDISTNDGNIYGDKDDMIMYPGGHGRNKTVNLKNILKHKWKSMENICNNNTIIDTVSNLRDKTPQEMQNIYNLKF